MELSEYIVNPLGRFLDLKYPKHNNASVIGFNSNVVKELLSDTTIKGQTRKDLEYLQWQQKKK